MGHPVHISLEFLLNANCQYPFDMSVLMKNFAPNILSKKLSSLGLTVVEVGLINLFTSL